MKELFRLVAFMCFCVCSHVAILLLPTVRTWKPGDHSKAKLGRMQGALLIAAYALVAGAYGILVTYKAEVLWYSRNS